MEYRWRLPLGQIGSCNTEYSVNINIISSLLKNSSWSGLGAGVQLLDVNQGGRHAPGRVIQCHHSNQVPVLQSSDKHIKKIFECKLYQCCEDWHEANDDKIIQGRGISTFWDFLYCIEWQWLRGCSFQVLHERILPPWAKVSFCLNSPHPSLWSH